MQALTCWRILLVAAPLLHRHLCSGERGEGEKISYCSACYTGKHPTEIIDGDEFCRRRCGGRRSATVESLRDFSRSAPALPCRAFTFHRSLAGLLESKMNIGAALAAPMFFPPQRI